MAGAGSKETGPRGAFASTASLRHLQSVIDRKNAPDPVDQSDPRPPAGRLKKEGGIDRFVGGPLEAARRVDELRIPAERSHDRFCRLSDSDRSIARAIEDRVFEMTVGRQDRIDLVVDVKQVANRVGMAPDGESAFPLTHLGYC